MFLMASFSFIFKQTLQQILQQFFVKIPIQYCALGFDSQPSDYESPPLTTRPGLPLSDKTNVIF